MPMLATPPTNRGHGRGAGFALDEFRDGFRMPVVKTVPRRPAFGIVQYVAWNRTEQRSPAQLDAAFAAPDPLSTASTELDRGLR